MPWIKVHHSIRDHHKMVSAALALKIPEPQMVGHLALLWLWVIENADDGVLNVPDGMIARAAGWRRPAGPFVRALLEAGFLSEVEPSGFRMVNYEEHIEPIITATERNRRRQEAHRQRKSDHLHIDPATLPPSRTAGLPPGVMWIADD